jgi:plasmid stabilization system protein ParE
MARKIRSTKRADKRFEEIKDYLNDNFGEVFVAGFVKRVFAFYDILTEFPRIGTLHDRERGIYGFVLEKQVSVFYRFNDQEVVILNFYDNRSGPDRRKY